MIDKWDRGAAVQEDNRNRIDHVLRAERFAVVAAVAATLLVTCSDGAAQTSCPSKPLALGTEVHDALEPSDCPIVRHQRPTVGDYWTVELHADDLVVFEVVRTDGRNYSSNSLLPLVGLPDGGQIDPVDTSTVIVFARLTGLYQVIVTFERPSTASDFGAY